MSMSCDWGGPSVYSESEVVARKEYPCVECCAPILKGERHLRWAGLWDGSWSYGRQHLLCRDACVWIRDALNDECIPFGALHEWWKSGYCPSDAPSGAVRIGVRIYAMVRRRERLAQKEAP